MGSVKYKDENELREVEILEVTDRYVKVKDSTLTNFGGFGIKYINWDLVEEVTK